MKANQVNRRMFINTMIFAVISVIALIVLLVLFIVFQNSSIMKRLTPLMFTVILGLLAVVVYCLLKINVVENQTEDLLKETNDHELNPDACPDYFTAQRDEDNQVKCVNEYKAPRSDAVFEFVSMDADKPVPDELLLADYRGHKFNKACGMMNPSSPDDPVYNIPWTGMRAKCESISGA